MGFAIISFMPKEQLTPLWSFQLQVMEDSTNRGLNNKELYYITQLGDEGQGSFGSIISASE